MRLSGGLLAIAIATVACEAPPAQIRAPDVSHLGACRYSTDAEWQSFVERAAHDEPWVKSCDDGACNAAAYLDVATNVASVFAECAGFLADNPPLQACSDNLRRFTASWIQQHDSLSYGFTTTNAEYFARQSEPDVPEGMMTPPAALLAQMPSLDKVEDAARSLGVPYVVQRSSLGGTRLFALTSDPAGRFDQWTLMNLREGSSPAAVNGRVSFLAVQRTNARGATLPNVRVHFRDYLVASSPGGGTTLTSDATDNAKCYSCHASGVRRLVGIRTPSLEAKPSFEDGGVATAGFPMQRLTAMNERLGSYGLNDWNGAIIVGDHGPPLGQEQGCTACHDGQQRGVLNASTSPQQLREKIQNELAMPPMEGLSELVERRAMKDPPLAPDESLTLDDAESAHAKLLAEVLAARAPALEAWMLSASCE